MEEINEQLYTKGFQEGYLIASKLPDLAKELSKTKVNDDRGKGLLAGIKQFDKDKHAEISLAKSYRDQSISQMKLDNRRKDRGIDKD